MSVGAVDRGQNTDKSRNDREDYEKKEAELVKKHQQELARIAKRHQEDLRKLQTAHTEQMDSFQDRTKEILSEREKKFQKDIQEVQKLHREQQERLAKDYDEKNERLETQAHAEKDDYVERTDIQKKNLQDQYENSFKKTDENYRKSTEEMRAQQKESLEEQSNRLNTAHYKERTTIQKERNEKVNKLNQDLAALRRQRSDDIQDLKGKLQEKDEDYSDRLENELRREQESNKKASEVEKQGFEESLDQTRDRYRKALAQRDEIQKVNHEKLKSDVMSRENNQMRVLENKLADTRLSTHQQELDQQRQAEIEKKNIKSSLGQNIEQLQRERGEIINSLNADQAEEMARASKSMDEAMSFQNTRYRHDRAMQNMMFEDNLNTQVRNVQAENQQLRMGQDTAAKKVREQVLKEKAVSENHFRGVIDQMKKQHDDDVKNIRVEGFRERNTAIGSLEEQMRKNEAKTKQEAVTTVQKYENRLSEVQEKAKQEQKAQVELSQKTLTQERKSNVIQLEAQEAQAQSRLVQMKEGYEKEIAQLKKHYQADIQKLNEKAPTKS